MAQPQIKHISLADYLAIEREDDVRYEYHYGEIFAMAGGTIAHAIICSNVANTLYNAAGKSGNCQTFTSELKIEIKFQRRYVYPDASVFCEPIEESEGLTGAATNPTLLVEVLSDSSAGYDLGKKFSFYRRLPSLREYLIISQTEPSIILFRRHKDSELYRIFHVEGLDAEVELDSIGATIRLEELYRNVEFPAKPER